MSAASDTLGLRGAQSLDCAEALFSLDRQRPARSVGGGPAGVARPAPGTTFHAESALPLPPGGPFRPAAGLRLPPEASFWTEVPSRPEPGPYVRSEGGIPLQPGGAFRTDFAILLAGSCICVPKRAVLRHGLTVLLHKCDITINAAIFRENLSS